MFTLTQSFDNEGEVEEAKKEGIEFLEAGENSEDTLESAEEPLDLVTLLVKRAVEDPGVDAIGLGGTTGTMPRSSTSCRVSSPS